MNKVIARFKDGRLLKGVTNDFTPAKELFHIVPVGASLETPPTEVQREDLKAVFFVKDYEGNPDHNERKDFDAAKQTSGRRIKVVFKDDEVLVGITLGYQKGRPGFFFESVDDESNILRCYVVSSATKEISFV